MKQNEEMRLTYSGIVATDGKKKILIKFEEGRRSAEGSIPDCKISKSSGFAPDEVVILEKYLQMNQMELIKKAKEINVFRSFFTEGAKDEKKV